MTLHEQVNMQREQLLLLRGEVIGLELVLKTLMGMYLASQAKDEAGFSRVADLSAETGRWLTASVPAMLVGMAPETTEKIGTVISATVARCFDQSAEWMNEMARVVLEVSPPASDAKN
jgi:N-methylhydantoinase B/oxoprolinase/acetone carboxylase alpha subunit